MLTLYEIGDGEISGARPDAVERESGREVAEDELEVGMIND